MRTLVVTTLTAFVGLQVAARSQPPPSPAQPTFRAGTALVEVSAVVRRDGQPVTDLRAGEIVIRDNGEPQALVAFEYVDLGRGDTPAQRRDFVLLVDDLHIHPARTQPTIDAALAFVDALGPHDRLATVHTAADDVLAFSTDRDAARARVRAVRGQGLVSSPAPGELEYRAERTLQMVREVCAAMKADAAERRAILFVSEGHVPFTPELRVGARRDVQGIYFAFLDVLREAAMANVAFYTVDPRGLRATSGVSDLAGSLAALAVNTGGIQTRWTNDLTANYARLLQDSRQYYRMAYVQPEPPPGRKQPATRRIEVTVSRPGVEVRARQRYAPARTS